MKTQKQSAALPAATLPDVRLLDEQHADAMRELFANVFNQHMSPQFWHWKYRQGDGCSVGVFIDGKLVAHYGGIGADILCFGKPARAVQIVDVMVSSSARRMSRKQSPFFLAGAFFLEHFIGYDNPYLLGYGFPSDRHMRLAEHLQLYAPVGRMHEVTWQITAAEKGPGLRYKLRSLTSENFARYAPQLDSLWQALARDLQRSIVVCKDAAWVNRRYLQNPDQQYSVYLLTRRLSKAPPGLIVLKEEAESVLLMDYIGPLANLPQLQQCARFLTADSKRSSLRTWCSESEIGRFKTTDATCQALPITTPANIWTKGPAPSELLDRWWLMPGDTDFL